MIAALSVVYINIPKEIYAQGIVNNGAKIVITTGSKIYINGSTGNYTSLSNGIITNDTGSTITLVGSWVNNSSNTGFSGTGSTVVLVGSSQQIGGTNATTFYNLIGSGIGSSPINYDLTINNSLNLSTNQILDINGKTLTIVGSVSGSGMIKGSSSSNLVINGSGALGTINFDQTNADSRTLNNLTLNRTSSTTTIGNPLEVKGTLLLNNGTLASGGNLKLVSNSNGTARIPTITGTGTITGNIIVERYIPSSARRWRFMSSPITNATLLDWRGEIFLTGAGSGTTVGTYNSNGFDATTANTPSVYYYDEPTTGNLNYGWIAAPNISSPITTGLGYRVFVRGDRSSLNRLTGVDNTQNAVTMNLIGPVNTGDITMPISYTNNSSSTDDGWNLLGNPYPSQFDWNAFWNAGNSGNNGTYYSKIDPTIYIWDASSNTYKSYNALTSSGSITNGIISIGQGFMAKATGVSPSMTFKEVFKSSTSPLQLFKTAQSDEIKIRLTLDSINYDDFVLKYNPNATAQNDAYDIKKWANPSVNISSFGSDSILHTLDTRPILTGNDTINLNVTASNGSIKIRIIELPVNGKYYFLQDLYLSNTISIIEGTTYTFNVQSSIPATQGYSRFRIISSDFNALPVSFGSFNAEKFNKTARLSWTTNSEINADYFEIQHSIDNMNFKSISSIKANGNSIGISSYKITDENPDLYSINYYRIKQVDLDGHFQYSITKEVSFNNIQSTNKLRVFPNPSSALISISADFTGNNCQLQIISVEGILVIDQPSLNIQNGEINLDVSGMIPGIFIIKIKEQNGNMFETKFIKE